MDYSKSWYALKAATNLIQGAGRGVRAADDFAVTYILDALARWWLVTNKKFFPHYFREALREFKPVSIRLPEALQPVGWQLIEAVSSKAGPTSTVSSKVCRVLRNAIESGETNGNGHKPRSRSHPSRERPFVQAAQRLSAYQGFEPGTVTAHIEKLPSAWSVYAACSKLIERCQLVQERLAERFPELTDVQPTR
jgi:hypothetical protein